MKDRTKRRCTVAFYELVLGTTEQRFPGRNWQDDLHRMERDGPSSCAHSQGEIDGTVIRTSGERGLLLGTDRLTAPRQRNVTTNQRQAMKTRGEDWEPTEESFVRFYENNIFGLLRTSQSAPSHAAVAAYLNHARQPSSRWFAKPVVAKDRYERLSEMRGVSSVSVAARPKDVSDPRSSMVRDLLGLGTRLSEDVRIEVKITAARGASGGEDRDALLGTALSLLDDLNGPDGTHSVEKAKVSALPVSGGPTEVIDLIEQRLTRAVLIPITSMASRVLDEAVAMSSIEEAYGELRDELRSAVGRA